MTTGQVIAFLAAIILPTALIFFGGYRCGRLDERDKWRHDPKWPGRMR